LVVAVKRINYFLSPLFLFVLPLCNNNTEGIERIYAAGVVSWLLVSTCEAHTRIDGIRFSLDKSATCISIKQPGLLLENCNVRETKKLPAGSFQ
jgi:hypothetical protein